MQEWLCLELRGKEGLSDLISNREYLDEITEDNKNTDEVRFIKSFKNSLSSLEYNTIISEDENISLKRKESLKPDLLLYSSSPEGIVIVELKNIKNPTRQVGTELSAYSNSVLNYLPFLPNGDLYHVIISTCWPTLLKNYIFHEIYWQKRNLICLEPVGSNTNISLEIKDISTLLSHNIPSKISENYLSGYHLCLYDYDLYKGGCRKKLDKNIEQMKAAILLISAEGNRQNSHGFSFLWRDLAETSLTPYNITVVNISPFELLERFILQEREFTKIQRKLFKIVRELTPGGQNNSLTKIVRPAKELLANICSPQPEIFESFPILERAMDQRADYIAFQGWGVFGDLFNEYLIAEFSSENDSISITSPHLGWRVVESIIDSEYEHININNVEFLD